jgi:hypothetical protein
MEGLSWHQYKTILKRNIKLLRRAAKFQLICFSVFFGVLAIMVILQRLSGRKHLTLSIGISVFLVFIFQLGTVSKLVTFLRKEKDNKFLSIYKFMGLKETPYYLATLTGFYIFSVGGMMIIAIFGHLIGLFNHFSNDWINFWLLSMLFLIACCNYAAVWSLVIRGTEDVATALTNLMMFIMTFM